jgi:citrate synthase
MVWMTATEALEVLNVRPQTLYANVSRGKIRAKPDDGDPRRSLYHRDDVLRMARRANGRRKVEVVSAGAMQYGDPVLPSSISTAVDGRLLYRGHDAVALADTASLEDIAALLWECDAAESAALWPAGAGASPAAALPGGALAAGLLALAHRSAADAPSRGRPAAELRADAAAILVTLADAMTGRSHHGPISVRLATAWRAEAHEDLIRRALVLLADHELNASTFATRVAISTGASLSAGVLAGFTTLTGPLHGGASAEFAELVALAGHIGASDAVRQWLAGGRALPAFGHPLYADGDPRARALLKLLPELQPYAELSSAAEAQAGELPNIDYALSLLAAACGLPTDAPFILFAVGRCVGWLAHALEQVQANRLIRPRARYTGPAWINAGIC